MHTNESSENYLETILILSKKHPVVRSVDVATELNFKKSSVSVAMKKLRLNNDIEVSPEGYITLTESGREIAERIYERHEFLSTWLTSLGVDPLLFGVLFSISTVVGALTPPVGLYLFLSMNIAEAPFRKAISYTAPVVLIILAVMLLMWFFPPIVTLVPNLLMGA